MFVSHKGLQYSYTILALQLISVFLILLLGIFVSELFIKGGAQMLVGTNRESFIIYGFLFLIILSVLILITQAYVTFNSNSLAYFGKGSDGQKKKSQKKKNH
jgi:hypothetical protein